jgi:serine phosphatase RsbU (regulator of sigma subunit)
VTRADNEAPESKGLHCKEIRGGIEPRNERFHVPGIQGWIFAQPWQSRIGGDIHFIGLCGHGMLSRFVVADVAGHGRRVAQEAKQLRDILAGHMNNPDQSQLVAEMNRELALSSREGQFATALVLSYLAPLHHVVIVNAGHPRPLLRRAKENRWQLLDNDSPDRAGHLLDLPLGVLDQTGYRQFALALEPDDLLILYSDSLIEACDPQGKALGHQGLLDLARSLRAQTPGQWARRLHQGVLDYQQGSDLQDDVTIVVLRHTGRDPEVVYDDAGNPRPFDGAEFRSH